MEMSVVIKDPIIVTEGDTTQSQLYTTTENPCLYLAVFKLI